MPAVDIFPFLHAIDELSREKRDVEEAIKQGFLQIKLAAKFLMSDNNRDAQERDPEFMQQQKEALQEALKKLVDEERATTRLTTALSEMRNDAGLHDQLKNAAAVDGDLPDFNAVLKAKLESSGKSAASAYDKHPRYREVMELFQEQMDEDDELHVMPTQEDPERALKCPITATLLVDPVMGPCKHSFSKEAVGQYIRTKGAGGRPVKCPVPGCSGMLTKGTLTVDAEKAQLLKRFHHRSQARMTQDDDDEDEYEDAEEIDD